MKVIIVGNYAVGKTCIINRHIYNQFSSNVKTTIGASFFTKSMTIDKKEVKINFWDTASSELYNSLQPIFYKKADIALIVYDVTNIGSFNESIRLIDAIRREVENITIILVGNKIDLKSVIDINDAIMIANRFGVPLKVCSAYTGEGVKELFDLVDEKIRAINQSSKPAGLLESTIKLDVIEKTECCK